MLPCISGDGVDILLTSLAQFVVLFCSCSVQPRRPPHCHGSSWHAIPRPTPDRSRPSSLQPQRAGIFLCHLCITLHPPEHKNKPHTTLIYWALNGSILFQFLTLTFLINKILIPVFNDYSTVLLVHSRCTNIISLVNIKNKIHNIIVDKIVTCLSFKRIEIKRLG